MIFQIRIADTVVRIESMYPQVYRQCCMFLDESALPAFCIAPQMADLEAEARLDGYQPPLTESQAAYYETLTVYRQIADQLLERQVLLMHGAVVAVGQAAFLFTAPSGTGKTTHINLWLKNIPGSFVVNGDKPLLRVGEGVTAYGTPWAGKEFMYRNCAVPLRAIVLLDRGETNCITPLEPGKALRVLLRQLHKPADPAGLTLLMQLIGSLGRQVRFFRLQCNMEDEAALIAWEALRRT